MKRKWLLLLAIIPVLSCLCIGLLVAQGARAGGERGATQTATAQFLDPLRALCTGQAAGVAGAAAYAPGPGLHPVIAFRARDAATFDRDPRIGTGDWAPRSVAEAQLVACLDESWETIESCSYDSRTSDGTRYLIRSQHRVTLRLFAARSGESVATATLTGSEPRACQETETFATGTTRVTVSGEAVTASAIQAWLQPYVAP
jgi:hypothetical protein